jgi:hypothetical protein
VKLFNFTEADWYFTSNRMQNGKSVISSDEKVNRSDDVFEITFDSYTNIDDKWIRLENGWEPSTDQQTVLSAVDELVDVPVLGAESVATSVKELVEASSVIEWRTVRRSDDDDDDDADDDAMFELFVDNCSVEPPLFVRKVSPATLLARKLGDLAIVDAPLALLNEWLDVEATDDDVHGAKQLALVDRRVALSSAPQQYKRLVLEVQIANDGTVIVCGEDVNNERQSDVALKLREVLGEHKPRGVPSLSAVRQYLYRRKRSGTYEFETLTIKDDRLYVVVSSTTVLLRR